MGGALALMMMVCAPAWADLKIGFVDYAMLMQQSPQAKAVIASLQRQSAAKQTELSNDQQRLRNEQDELNRNGATMTPDARNAAEQSLRDGQRELAEKQQQYQDDMEAEQNLETSKLQKVIVAQVQQYAAAQHFDLVLADGVIWASPAINITQPILAELQASAVTRVGTTGSTRSRSGR